ncbi:cytochrome c oxidase subunit 6B2 [Cymbomonas tetramitiformis]|uniref:Cytochrome c oxidase subunit 6B2 n=1 Tax=Cymbomonas tetramitiformis TaxID=36881 RepID=A0AAE0C794_9CHLO|nr:cytochrome c oxidase subunit 6B2 [Cymbomonas tetramitiformis]|eukprot:gene19295-23066_t
MGNSVSHAEAVEEEVVVSEEVVEAAPAEAEPEPVEEEAEEEIEIKIGTAKFDPRFPTTNQAKHCYTRYNEFHKCEAEAGADCEKFGKAYRSICPQEWVLKWNEQREEGTWAGKY